MNSKQNKVILYFLRLLTILLAVMSIYERATACVPAERTVFGVSYSMWHNSSDQWKDYWGTPLLGYYLSSNEAVMEKHAKALGDAGIDFVYVDWSNDIDVDLRAETGKNLPIEENTLAMISAWSYLQYAPRIAIMLGLGGNSDSLLDGRLQKRADQVFDYVVRPLKSKYQSLYDKPLLIIYVGTPSPFQSGLPNWNDRRFTIKWMTGFLTDQGNLMGLRGISKYGYWSWEDKGNPSHSEVDGVCEEMNIVASWRSAPGKISPGRNDGRTFLYQWQLAKSLRPRILLLGTFNEWLRGEQPSPSISKDLEDSLEFGKTYLSIVQKEIEDFNSKH